MLDCSCSALLVVGTLEGKSVGEIWRSRHGPKLPTIGIRMEVRRLPDGALSLFDFDLVSNQALPKVLAADCLLEGTDRRGS